MHTYLDGCCARKEEQIPSKVVRRAQELGLTALGFVVHYYSSDEGLRMTRQLKSDLSQLEPGSVRVFLGVEADLAAPGRLTITPQEIEELDLDFVILAPNHFHSDFYIKPSPLTPESARDSWLAGLHGAIDSGLADIIPHPVINLHHALGDMNRILAITSDEQILEFCEHARANDIALDVNPRLFTENEWWKPEIQFRFYRLCRKSGVKLSPCSDSHQLSEIGDTFKLSLYDGDIGWTSDDFIDADWVASRRERRLSRNHR